MEKVDDRIAKRASGNFSLDDISEYPRKKAKPNTKVYVLKLGQWVLVNNHQIFLSSVGGDMDDAWIEVAVREQNKWLDWLKLPLAGRFSKKELVVWWHRIPGTNLMLDVWYVGDGSGGVPLVFEVNEF